MSSFFDSLSYILSSDPDWLYNPLDFNVAALLRLNHQVLKHLASHFRLHAKNKQCSISSIANRVLSLSSQIISLSDDDLFQLSPSITCTSRLHFITLYFESRFGANVALALCFAHVHFPLPPFVIPSNYLQHYPWMAFDRSLYVSRFCRLPLPFLRLALSSLHPNHVSAYWSSSNKSCAEALLLHVWKICAWLCTCDNRDFAAFVCSSLPTLDVHLSDSMHK
jgi:hypothetical protein